MYLEEGMNVLEMYRLYSDEMKLKSAKAVSFDMYDKIFNKEFNLGFYVPVKDRFVYDIKVQF